MTVNCGIIIHMLKHLSSRVAENSRMQEQDGSSNKPSTLTAVLIREVSSIQGWTMYIQWSPSMRTLLGPVEMCPDKESLNIIMYFRVGFVL